MAERLGTGPLGAARLALPPRVRRPVTALERFCRSLQAGAEELGPAPNAMAEAEQRVELALAGRPRGAGVDRAFAVVARDHALPRPIFDWLLQGYAWDAAGRRYATIEALLDYCVRVAGTVGLCVCAITGRRRKAVLERACELAVAIQLTTIASRVGADARRGRLYLPIEWLEEAGADADHTLAERQASPATRAVTRRLLQTADTYYLRADPGLPAIPFDCRPGARAARYLCAALGSEIERAGYDTVTNSPSLSVPRTLRVIARALRPSQSELRPLVSLPLPESAPLIDAIASTSC